MTTKPKSRCPLAAHPSRYTPSMPRPVLLCLHGWGGSEESFTELREALKGTDIEILTPDLPGFGGQPDPPAPWNIDDYAKWVVTWLPTQRHSPLFLLGHSMGGQIAAYIAAKKMLPIDVLFLCAPAIVRGRLGLRRSIGALLAKSGKMILSIPGLRLLQPAFRRLLYTLVRVHDYESASPVMQQTLVRVSHQPLTALLPSIAVPTEIFWGRDDRQTPPREARIVHRGIAKSNLHLYAGIRHAVHRAKAGEIAKVICEHLTVVGQA